MERKRYESLRSTTIRMIGILFVLLILVIYMLLDHVMMGSIDKLERNNVEKTIEMAEKSIRDEASSLAAVAQDWAAWDDTYAFVDGGNKGYEENNLHEEGFLNMELNLMAFIDKSGNYVFAKGMDFESQEFVPVYPELKGALVQSHVFDNSDKDFKTNGIVMLPEGPLLVATHPVITSEFKGPVRGNVVFGRFLDEGYVEGLSDRLKLDISLEKIDPAATNNVKQDVSADPADNVEINVLDDDRIAGRTVLTDIYGQPAMYLMIELPRDVSKVGKTGVDMTLYALIVAGLIFTAGIILFLERNILSRLFELSKDVFSIGSDGLKGKRLKDQKKNDEIHVLSDEINQMLDRLEDSEQMVRESEEKYRTFVEKGTDVIYSLDHLGICSYVSPNCIEVLGYESEEMVGKPFSSFIHMDERDKWDMVMNDTARDIERKEGFEYRAILKNSSWKWFHTKISRLEECRDEKAFIGILYDVHNRKQAEEALKQANDNLETRVHERTLELSITNERLQDEILEREKIQKKITHLAYHDHLTGLPNRLLFIDRLNQSLFLSRRSEKPLGVFFLDLDDFKIVNDTMGHDAGDELLKEVAQRLAGAVRKDDTVSRFGGDEFTLMVQNLHEPEDVIKVADKVIDSLKEPFKLKGQDFYVTGSVGVALYPTDGENAETLMKNADMAMYKAKGSGRNQYVLCTPVLKEKVMETMMLTNSLYRALERDELMLYYQPQVSCASGRIIGFEALLRWNHPEMGFISPSKFIPVAEQTGLIIPIGEWVLRTACNQNRMWQDMGYPNLRMAVNLSICQLKKPDLVEKVKHILEETGMDREHLELEITESIAMNEEGIVLESLNEFKKLNISISIDDFGTEYSSLTRLKKLPIDRIKIAMPFIQGIAVSDKDEAITKAIIVLAKNLGLQTIAEGVETSQQLSFLSQRMCDEIQGFYYYKPLPAHDIEDILGKEGVIEELIAEVAE